MKFDKGNLVYSAFDFVELNYNTRRTMDIALVPYEVAAEKLYFFQMDLIEQANKINPM